MLQRPRGFDHNQENPYAGAGPSHHNNNHKTPARSFPHGKGPAPVTGGKGAIVSTIGRGVLGRKDGNQGKGGGSGKDSALLFPSKPTNTTSTAGPSQPQSFKTPASKPRSLRPLADLQTPATALRPKRAPVLVPSPEVEREPEVDVEAEQAAKLQEMMDREVEYAGPSATDYEEPYEPECPVTDYKTANYGDFLRAMSFNGIETYEELEARDEVERKQVEFPLEEATRADSDVEAETGQLFPVPASKTSAPQRAPLAQKTSNSALSSSARSSSDVPAVRKPGDVATSSLRRPALQPSLSAPTTATRRLLANPAVRKPLAPTSSLSRSTNTSGVASSSRRPLAASTSARPTSSLSQSSSSAVPSAPRSRPGSLVSTTRKLSSSSLRQSASTSAVLGQKAREQEEEETKRREQFEAEERKLGAFGLVGDGELSLLDGVDAGLGDFASAFGEDGEDFKLDLELE